MKRLRHISAQYIEAWWHIYASVFWVGLASGSGVLFFVATPPTKPILTYQDIPSEHSIIIKFKIHEMY